MESCPECKLGGALSLSSPRGATNYFTHLWKTLIDCGYDNEKAIPNLGGPLPWVRS